MTLHKIVEQKRQACDDQNFELACKYRELEVEILKKEKLRLDKLKRITEEQDYQEY